MIGVSINDGECIVYCILTDESIEYPGVCKKYVLDFVRMSEELRIHWRLIRVISYKYYLI